MQSLLKADAAVFHLINQGLARPFLDPIMLALSSPYLWGVLGALVLIAAFIRRDRRYLRLAILIGISAGASDAISYHVLKPWVARPRPCYQLSDVRLVAPGCGSRESFPSNHAANGMAVAVSAVLVLRSWSSLLFIVAALLVGLSRIYLGVHFPLDVLGGFGVGTLVAVLVFVSSSFMQRRLGKQNPGADRRAT